MSDRKSLMHRIMLVIKGNRHGEVDKNVDGIRRVLEEETGCDADEIRDYIHTVPEQLEDGQAPESWGKRYLRAQAARNLSDQQKSSLEVGMDFNELTEKQKRERSR